MKVTVNGTTLSVPSNAAPTVQDLLDYLRQQGHVSEDSVVTTMVLRGETWNAGDIIRHMTGALQDSDDLVLETTLKRDHGMVLMDEMVEMLTVLLNSTPLVARKLREEPVGEANVHLFRLLDALQQFVTCLYSIQTFCGMRGKPLDAHHAVVSRLTDTLSKMQLCQQLEDWGRLADLLEDDLKAALEGLHTVIEAMRDEF